MEFKEYKFTEKELKAIEEIRFYFSEENIARLLVLLGSKLDKVNERIDKIIDYLK